jgi:alpha-mannosidase
VYSLDKVKRLPYGSTSILSEGPTRASIIVEQVISEHSWLKTTISLDAATPNSLSYLEYNCEVEWREACKFLKVEFPVDINSDFATYDSMYGSVRRPTHYNTSWDVAKFEVCCHKYADYSDHTYGVTLLNDSKYGCSIHGRIMRLSLLRAAKAPDGNADMGRHSIRFAILGHSGPISGDIVRAAYNFNHPLIVTPAGAGTTLPFVTWEGPSNVILSTVKRAEDDADVSSVLPAKRKSKSLVVRLYDSLGGKSSGHIVSDLPVKKAFITNLLEDDKKELAVKVDGPRVCVPVSLRAFEITSVRLEL